MNELNGAHGLRMGPMGACRFSCAAAANVEVALGPREAGIEGFQGISWFFVMKDYVSVGEVDVTLIASTS
jgi:hypothetical protein